MMAMKPHIDCVKLANSGKKHLKRKKKKKKKKKEKKKKKKRLTAIDPKQKSLQS